ncbi:hypothetical protein CLMAG_27110 [Clostridium magnum DSM 2767]|uniref:Uncharacterized protein n=1 Tax=Clostridium magnum DSM 2767 TaxID=1121326 RepID=A0A162TPS7_9CLOT|nr:hypothetical protein CLMAG_27110 [Clostridium magnum DSM 2767]
MNKKVLGIVAGVAILAIAAYACYMYVLMPASMMK